MLTIFGKKKKEGKPDEAAQVDASPEKVSSKAQNSSQATVPSTVQATVPSTVQATRPTPVRSSPPVAASDQYPFAPQYESEETSLNKLLQSLLQDLPPGIAGSDQREGLLPASTPEYVPLRSTPPSRAMTIEPGKKGKDEDLDEIEMPEKQAPAPPPVRTLKPPEPQASKVETKPPPIPQKREEPAEKAVKIEKPEKPEKPSKETLSRKDAKASQKFDHIFQLTQGNLETPSLAIINGPQGSGKTTLCSGLAGNYLGLGNPCIYVTYDEAPSSLRDRMKKLGVDPTESESSFRLAIVDGYTTQNDSFSMEPYYVEKPFEFESVEETVVRNSEFFTGEKIRVIIDSVDVLASKLPAKEFVKSLGLMVSKLKDNGATIILTAGLSKLSKDVAAPLEELADCVIDLFEDESDHKGRQLKVRRLNHSSSKMEPETLELDSNKGLVFV